MKSIFEFNGHTKIHTDNHTKNKAQINFQSTFNTTPPVKNELKMEPKVVVSGLSNQDLMGRFGKLVQTERKITELVLECIIEIDRRKIYLEKAYPSLFEFLVKEFGYSPSSAMRRIESARLLKEIPEMSEKIKSGAINLSQLAKVQQTIRAIQKTSHVKIATTQKKEILNKIEFKTQAKTELILAQEFNLPHVHFEKEKVHKDESITLTMTFTKEQMELLEKVQNLISHIVPDKKWSEMFTYLAQKEIKSRSPKVEAKVVSNINEDDDNGNRNDNHEAKRNLEIETSKNIKINSLTNKSSKHISLKTRKTVLDPKNAGCQFKDPSTQKKCGSKKFLQMDHIQPRWAGGGNKSSNFQALCAQHNRYRYKIQVGLLPLR